MFILSGFILSSNNSIWEISFSSNANSNIQQLFKIVSSNSFLIVARDDSGYVFGGYSSNTIPSQIQNAYISDNNSFVFTLLPEAITFSHCGAHNNAVYFGDDGIGFGGEKGRMALFIESALNSGHSFDTETFGNRGSLASFEDFEITELEVWVFHE
eukprot:c21753_g2_i2.p1 GENE.c21753_g2_i2~~c21753_g2_i2.p1  ORF type:complete len:156 (-),score=66.33 c21753_g2_i2:61-528(-)